MPQRALSMPKFQHCGVIESTLEIFHKGNFSTNENYLIQVINITTH